MESVFREVGTCGCFQISHILCVQFIRFVCACGIYLMAYGNYEPPWYCFKNDTLPEIAQLNGSHVNDSSNSQELYFKTDTDNETGTSFHHTMPYSTNSSGKNYATVDYPRGTCRELSTCQKVIFDPTSVTLVTDFDLICDRAYIPSLMIAINMIGISVGSFIVGLIGDMFGRKISIYSSLALTSAAMITSSFSNSWQMYGGLIFFIGLGLGGIITTYMVYTLEFVTSKWRGYFNAIPVWSSCLLLFSCIVTGLKNWRHVHIVCGSMGVAFLLFALWTPESLRWLYVHKREDEAKKVIKKIMKCNGRKRDVDNVFHNLRQADDCTINVERKYTYLDLFRTPQLRALTIKVSLIFCLSVMAYFTLGFSVKSFSGNYYANLFISFASEAPFVIMLGTCVNHLGRKWTMALFMWLATLILTTITIMYYVISQEMADSIIKYLAFLAKGCLVLIWSGMTLFAVELYPTEVRSLAQGFFNTVARLGGVVSSTLIPRDRESSAICFISLSGALLVSSVFILSFPETKNKPLVDRVEAEVSKQQEMEEMEETKRSLK